MTSAHTLHPSLVPETTLGYMLFIVWCLTTVSERVTF
eukprot:COSAG02_NODE_50192_length_322_cov_0.686099_1_plen_36_part_01